MNYELELINFLITKAKNYNKADETFVMDMLSHHKEAVKMAEKVISKGKDENISKLAKSIVTAQSKEIKLMETWLKDNNLEASSSRM